MDGTAPDALLLRPMTADDVPGIVALARAQGRNVASGDYERFLRLEGARGFVITRSDALLGAATAMRYFEHGFLGPVLLRDDADATGIAVALLAQLVEAIQREGCHVIDAEAAPTEELILRRMGFALVRRTLVMERPASAPGPAPDAPTSVPMAERHLLDVGALDAQVVGYGRKQYLMALREECPEGARVVERDGEVAGFVLLRRSPRGYHIGPLVTRAQDDEAARALLRDAVGAAEAPMVALAPEGPLVALLQEQGFRGVGELARMRAGSAAPPGEEDLATEWALGGRMTG